jgi:hypothetical protein
MIRRLIFYFKNFIKYIRKGGVVYATINYVTSGEIHKDKKS